MSTPSTLPLPNDDAPWKTHSFERDRLRSEIRTRMDRKLVELTGIADAYMHWTEAGFLDRVVFEYHCGVQHWPRRWPFKNLSSLKGGCEPLREIRDALVSGSLRIVRLTDEQLAEARANPESFLPNPTLRSEPDESPRAETYHVIPLVLHPHDLSPISHPRSSEPPSEAEAGPSSVASPLIRIVAGPESAPRRQRRDIKKRRRRPVTNPEDRPPRRRRLGVQTPEYVYDPVPAPAPTEADEEEEEEEDIYSMPLGSAPSDDYVECFTEPGTQSEAESEIESATESWACGSRSEIEDFTSDEE
ncbi:hypothetical protein LXA43DRAFT_1094557 [Ganoderma leucocontextum]|nr:hypothetical protein LXA43DRAFT_1094553 [Ganoderma leucocontextum]KAI1791411.1 hypothetical protein LXA43DRAFT_1094557 [Ganoderma leucocontextum]